MQVLEQVGRVEKLTADVDGLRINYLKAGAEAGDRPALVMMHGLVGSARNWDQNIEAMAAIRMVYAPDAVNMGESERHPGVDPGIEAQVARLIAFMDSVGIGVADFVGHSHGSAILIVLAARHPERVRRMALFCPPNRYCQLGLPQVRFYSTFLGGVFARRIIPLMPKFMYSRSMARLYGDPSRMTASAVAGSTDELMNTPTITHIVDVMRGWEADQAIIAESLQHLDPARTMLLWGDMDRAVAMASGRRISETTGIPLTVIAGTGHMPFLESPEECNEILLRWLNS